MCRRTSEARSLNFGGLWQLNFSLTGHSFLSPENPKPNLQVLTISSTGCSHLSPETPCLRRDCATPSVVMSLGEVRRDADRLSSYDFAALVVTLEKQGIAGGSARSAAAKALDVGFRRALAWTDEALVAA